MHTVHPLFIQCYHYLEKEHRGPSYTLHTPVEAMHSTQLVQLYEEVMDRIKFLCKDLLEVKEVQINEITSYHIDFLHRIIKDFLTTQEMHQELVQRATNKGAIPRNLYQAICYVQLARAKALPAEGGIEHRLNVIFSLVDALLFNAHEVEIEKKTTEFQLLDQLDGIISLLADMGMAYHWTNARDAPRGLYCDEANSNYFLAPAVPNRLMIYVEEKFKKDPKILSDQKGRPLSDYALRPNIVMPPDPLQPIDFIDFDMVRMLQPS